MTQPTILNERLEGLSLKNGAHDAPEKGLCFMEAVAYVRGLPHSDHPACVSPRIAKFGRDWNDALPDDETRTRLLAPLIPVVVGTATNEADELRRSWMAFDWLVRVHAPAWMDLTDSLKPHAANLRGLPEIDSKAALDLAWPVLKEARDASAAAWDAAGAAAWAAARDAAWDAAGAAARDAAWAAAWDAARDAAWAAAWAAARAAAWAAAGDAAGAAAGARLAPVTKELQESACDLIRRMSEVGR